MPDTTAEKKNGWIVKKEISARDIIQLSVLIFAIVVFFIQQENRISAVNNRLTEHLNRVEVHQTVTEREKYFVRQEVYSRDIVEIKSALNEIKETIKALEEQKRPSK